MAIETPPVISCLMKSRRVVMATDQRDLVIPRLQNEQTRFGSPVRLKHLLYGICDCLSVEILPQRRLGVNCNC